MLGALVLAPILLLAGFLAYRARVFDVAAGPLTAEESRTVFALLGTVVAAAVTATGLLLTDAHNQRTLAFQIENERKLADERARRETALAAEREAGERRLEAERHASEERLKLDTVVESLKIFGDGPTYATPAAVAGALTSMVVLGHPTVALRCLAAAWPDGPVPADTAAWIIGAAFREGRAADKAHALDLALSHPAAFVPSGPDQRLLLPELVGTEWDTRIPYGIRAKVLYFWLELLLCKPKREWGASGNYHVLTALLDEVVIADAELAASAADIVRIVLAAEGTDWSWTYRDRVKPVEEMRERCELHAEDAGPRVQRIQDRLPELETWAKEAGDSGPTHHPAPTPPPARSAEPSQRTSTVFRSTVASMRRRVEDLLA